MEEKKLESSQTFELEFYDDLGIKKIQEKNFEFEDFSKEHKFYPSATQGDVDMDDYSHIYAPEKDEAFALSYSNGANDIRVQYEEDESVFVFPGATGGSRKMVCSDSFAPCMAVIVKLSDDTIVILHNHAAWGATFDDFMTGYKKIVGNVWVTDAVALIKMKNPKGFAHVPKAKTVNDSLKKYDVSPRFVYFNDYCSVAAMQHPEQAGRVKVLVGSLGYSSHQGNESTNFDFSHHRVTATERIYPPIDHCELLTYEKLVERAQQLHQQDMLPAQKISEVAKKDRKKGRLKAAWRYAKDYSGSAAIMAGVGVLIAAVIVVPIVMVAWPVLLATVGIYGAIGIATGGGLFGFLVGAYCAKNCQNPKSTHASIVPQPSDNVAVLDANKRRVNNYNKKNEDLLGAHRHEDGDTDAEDKKEEKAGFPLVTPHLPDDNGYISTALGVSKERDIAASSTTTLPGSVTILKRVSAIPSVRHTPPYPKHIEQHLVPQGDPSQEDESFNVVC